MPPDLELRPRAAVPADYPAFVRFFAEFGVPEPPPSAEVWERDRLPGTQFFEAHGALLAYVYLEVLDSLGYVRNVVVDAGVRRRGVGRQVMQTIVQQLTAAGCTEFCLSVARDNAAAIRLYESVGMRRAYPAASLRLDWDCIDRLRDDTPQLPAGPVIAVLAEHDGRIERTFALPPGMLAARRRREGVVLLAACSARQPEGFVAFASFQPMIGAYPFRAMSAADARLLLHAMRPHAPDTDGVLLVVEDDARLERALLDAGAEAVLQLWHYRASLGARV